jgi:hypothetical protein
VPGVWVVLLMTLTIRAAVLVRQGEAGKAWDALFEARPDVDRVIVDVMDREILDVTVYFKDSSETFPLTSLREDSQVTRMVKDILELT